MARPDTIAKAIAAQERAPPIPRGMRFAGNISQQWLDRERRKCLTTLRQLQS